MRQTFSKKSRILKSSDFQVLKKDCRVVRDKYFKILQKQNNKENSRLGIVVSRKVGTSVTRNRLKRQIREFFRISMASRNGFDYVIIGRPGLTSVVAVNSLNNLYKKICKA